MLELIIGYFCIGFVPATLIFRLMAPDMFNYAITTGASYEGDFILFVVFIVIVFHYLLWPLTLMWLIMKALMITIDHIFTKRIK